MSRIVFGVVVFLVLGSPAHAGPAGMLDPSFGASGHVTTDIPTGAERALAVAVQADGKIVVGGVVGTTAADKFMLARYLADGRLDASFGTAGIVTTDVTPNVDDQINAIALQSDGKIVAAGFSNGHGFALARYAPDGSLDPTFGSAGTLRTIFVDGFDFATRVVIQPDGAIIAAGSSVPQTGPGGFALARFLSNGSLDEHFGADGHVLTSSGLGLLQALALLPDGRIVAGGGGVDKFSLARYLADGSLDPTFGSGGVVTTTVTESFGVTDLLPMPGNLLLAAGGDTKFILARYDSSGTLDTGFGSGGVLKFDLGYDSPRAGTLATQPDGKILFSGEANHLVLMRLAPDGTPDPTFGAGGHADFEPGGQFPEPGGLALQPDGKIVVTGSFGLSVLRILGGTCGNGVVEAGEDCDDGNLVSGDGCDASCCTADGDGDGICDANDPCTGTPAPASRPKIAIRFGVRTFALAGEVVLPHPFTPALDPPTKGFRLLISDAGGQPIDIGIPGAALLSGRAKWTTSTTSSGPRWKFSDPSMTQPGHIRGATILDRSGVTPGRVKFSVTGRNGYPAVAMTPPVSATLVFDAPTATTGQCTSLTFPGPPPAPTCTLDVAHQKLTCK